MKRAVPADYDPVYPYDKVAPSTQPPYINQNKGLYQSPPGALAVNLSAPLSFAPNGAIKVATAGGLQVSKGKLQAKLGTGLTLNDKDEITLNQANAQLTFEAPLERDQNNISLKIGQGLTTKDNLLQVVPLSFATPLDLKDNTVMLKLGNNLETNNSDGSLTVTLPTFSNPLQLSKNNVTLQFGAGLKLTNGVLTVAFPPPPSPLNFILPLKQTDQGVTLQLGNGLSVSSGQLQVTETYYSSPLTISSNTVSINIGEGLAIENDTLVATQSSATTYSPPLSKANNNVSLALGNGLTMQDNKLVTRLGTNGGLQYDNQGGIQLTQNPANTRITLWTGPDPPVNGSVNGQPVIRCFICLSRIDSLVTLTAKFRGEGSYAQIQPTQPQFNLNMYFNQFGQLSSTGNISANNTWGAKPWDKNEVDPNPHHFWRLCMPNSAVYTKAVVQPYYFELGLNSIKLDAAVYKKIDCLVSLNSLIGDPSANYSITFRFLNFAKLNGEVDFITDTLSFSYVGENLNTQ
ncbi:fiber [Bat mastadenovirus]|uniref:Fiber n=1 Tax=Bat mastadenovirus TaxID=740971 RepID=A0A3G9EJQ9_9ADEN|nr:fiber [Bat mastadenovirus]BBE29322.1 fiber [Bat mastadenovirus]